MFKRMLLFLLVVLVIFLLTACWDKLEIENNAFILGIGLDAAENSDEIEITFQIGLPQAFASEKKAEEAVWNITKTVTDIGSARRQLFKETNLVPNFEHCQILLIGEELGRKGIEDYMDFFFRAYDIRRRTDVAVVQGKAKDVLTKKLKSAPVPSFFISELMEQNNQYEYSITNIGNINNLQISSVEHSDFLLSRIIPLKDTIEVSGGGVFKDSRLAGWLSGDEVMATRFMGGYVSSGFIEVKLPPELADWIILRVFEAKTDVKPEIRNNKLCYVVKVRLEGDIEELRNPRAKTNKDFIRKIERALEGRVKEDIKKVFIKAQRELKADPFEFKIKTKYYLPKWWKANKDTWNEEFQNAEIDVTANVDVRRVGETTQ